MREEDRADQEEREREEKGIGFSTGLDNGWSLAVASLGHHLRAKTRICQPR